MKKKLITTEDLDAKFDRGEDISMYVLEETARDINRNEERLSVTLPAEVVNALDNEAKSLGISRQSMLTRLVIERLGS